MQHLERLAPVLLGALVVSCTGSIGVDPAPPQGEMGAGRPPANAVASHLRAGMRRLTKAELRSTIKDLLNVDPIDDLPLLPEDHSSNETPFDNDYTQQTIDSRYVGAIATIAENVAHK